MIGEWYAMAGRKARSTSHENEFYYRIQAGWLLREKKRRRKAEDQTSGGASPLAVPRPVVRETRQSRSQIVFMQTLRGRDGKNRQAAGCRGATPAALSEVVSRARTRKRRSLSSEMQKPADATGSEGKSQRKDPRPAVCGERTGRGSHCHGYCKYVRVRK